LAAEEKPLETTTIRFFKIPNVCIAPQLIARELLRAEGFTEISYIDAPPGELAQAIGQNKVDLGFDYAASFVSAIDAGEPITLLSGMMAGCVEVFANERVQKLTDLKGRNVGVPDLGATPHRLLTLMAAHVGLNPNKDIRWVATGSADLLRLFEKGEIDVFLGQPPESRILRARHVGHVILNTAVDRPWSSVFLLHAGGQPKLRSQVPGRYQTGATRHLESHRSVRHRSGRRSPAPCQ
jgi:NitT/TauT family transport system substrate-binding protein